MTRFSLDVAREHYYVGPKALPTSAFDEVTSDIWLEELMVVNQGNVSADVRIYDRQIPPIALIVATLSPGGMISLNSAGRPMGNGVTWSASSTDVHGWFRGFTLGVSPR